MLNSHRPESRNMISCEEDTPTQREESSAARSSNRSLSNDVSVSCVYKLFSKDGSSGEISYGSMSVIEREAKGNKCYVFDDGKMARQSKLNLEIVELDESIGYGHCVWPASIALSIWIRYFAQNEVIAGAHVLELGCGIGLPSFVLGSLQSPPLSIHATDMSSVVVEHFCSNASRNRDVLRSPVTARVLNWDDSIAPENMEHDEEQYDFITGADLVYNPAHAKTLVAAVNQYLSPSGTFLLMNFPERRRRGMDSFVQELKKHGSVSEVKYKLRESSQGLEKCSDIHLVIFKKYLLCICN